MPPRVVQSRRVVPSGDRASLELRDDPEGWLAESPSTVSTPSGVAEETAEGVEYEEWLESFPDGLERFGEIGQKLKGRKVALFLDYDGTLAPIVKNPDKAHMSEEMREEVKSIAECVPTAIISGRSIDKLRRFVQLDPVYYAGSHGLDIHTPTSINQKDITVFQPAAQMKPLIDAVYHQLHDRVQHISGASVEHNAFCLSVHYRNCSRDAWDEIKDIVRNVITEEPSLEFRKGRKVFDIRPRINWGKGKAVEHFLNAWSYTTDDVTAICLGDDTTDEDAFKALKDARRGFGIVVSSKAKETEAVYSLKDPSEVLKFLKQLTTWSRKRD